MIVIYVYLFILFYSFCFIYLLIILYYFFLFYLFIVLIYLFIYLFNCFSVVYTSLVTGEQFCYCWTI